MISLPEDDKKWLDDEAARAGVPMTELVRRAVRLLRADSARRRAPFEQLLRDTHGTWRHGDALDYQRRMRDEWS